MKVSGAYGRADTHDSVRRRWTVYNCLIVQAYACDVFMWQPVSSSEKNRTINISFKIKQANLIGFV